MKNSNENLMGGTWLLTFLQHQNALFFYNSPKNFSARGALPPCNPPPHKTFLKFSWAVCKFCHFCFYPNLPQKPGRNAVLCTTSALGFFPKMTLTSNNSKFIFYCK